MINNSIIIDESRLEGVEAFPSVEDIEKTVYKTVGLRAIQSCDLVAIRKFSGEYLVTKNRYYDTGVYSLRDFTLLEMYIREMKLRLKAEGLDE